MDKLIEAWGNYYFKNDDQYFKIERFFAIYEVYENIVDDIEEVVFRGNLEECIAWCKNKGAYNYDPLTKFKMEVN